jgi:hypothetical protein
MMMRPSLRVGMHHHRSRPQLLRADFRDGQAAQGQIITGTLRFVVWLALT